MSLFKKQQAFCMVCGTPFLSAYGTGRDGCYGSTCSDECRQEWDWRYTLYVMGRDYYLDPKREDA